MADIFISYSKKDVKLVSKLVEHIKNNTDMTVWWDTELLGGDKFRSEIRRQIGLARVVIVLWTRNSITSEWVQEEADEAIRFNKYIPVFDSSINPGIEIPFGLKSIQALCIDQKHHILSTLAYFLNDSELNSKRANLESFDYLKRASLIATLVSFLSLVLLQYVSSLYFYFVIFAVFGFSAHALFPRTFKVIKKSNIEPLITLKRMQINHRYLEVSIPLLLLFVLTFSLPKVIDAISDGLFGVEVFTSSEPTTNKKEESSEVKVGFQKFDHALREYGSVVLGLVIILGIPYLYLKGAEAVSAANNMQIWKKVSLLDSGNRFEYMDSYRLFFQELDKKLNFFYLLLIHPFLLSFLATVLLSDIKAPSPFWLYVLGSANISGTFIYFHCKVKRPIFL